MKNKTELQEHYVQIRQMKTPGNALSHPTQGFSQISIWKGTITKPRKNKRYERSMSLRYKVVGASNYFIALITEFSFHPSECKAH